MDQITLVFISARAVVTDIEGTTTPLAFVKAVLFPYARECLPDFVKQHHDDPAVAEQLRQARKIAGEELGLGELGNLLQAWTDQDRKIHPLKSLQAMVWRDGYQSGQIRGQVYLDAMHALQEWHRADVALYVYSSGSVQAQKLLFRYSEHGDLSGLFSGHFDLAAGGKMDVKSYAAVAHSIGLSPQDILFISDVEEELDAAGNAGMQTVWMIREGSMPAGSAHQAVKNFNAIQICPRE